MVYILLIHPLRYSNSRWFYRYDPFGRRIGKLASRCHWEHNVWELLVQQRQTVNRCWETDFFTSGHNGEPQAIFNQEGIVFRMLIWFI
nr:type IV secretion protein Rhs [Pectobacterium parmentieri]